MKLVFYITITGLLICSTILAMGFKPPEKTERLKAIGTTKGLPEILLWRRKGARIIKDSF